MLTDVTSVKAFLSITNTTEDPFLDILVPAVDAAVKKYLDRDIEQTSYVDYYGGNNTVILTLNEAPVISVSEVKEDVTAYYGSVAGTFGSTTILTSGVDYTVVRDGRNGLIEVGRLQRLNGCVWPCRWEYQAGLLTAVRKPGLGNIKVTYTAGYAQGSIPRDLQLACWLLAARIRLVRKRGGLLPQSESLAEYSYSLQQLVQQQLQLGTVEQLLSRYRRVRQRHKVLT